MRKEKSRTLPAGKSALPDPEREFALGILSGKWDPPPPALNKGRLLEICRGQRVAGILYRRLEKDMPGLARLFEKDYFAAAAANLRILAAMSELDARLGPSDPMVLVIKGAGLLDHIYPDPGLRPMEDADLMVRPGDAGEMAGILKEMGFVQDPYNPKLFRKNGVLVDLHVHPLHRDRSPARARLMPRGMEPVWERSVDWKSGSRAMKRLHPNDQVLLLCQHAMKHSYACWIQLVDILICLENMSPPQQAGLFEDAGRLGQERPLVYALYLLQKLFSFGARPEFGGLPAAGLTLLEKALLDARASGQPFGRLGEALALASVPRWSGRLDLLKDMMFPRTEKSFPARLPHALGLLAQNGALLLKTLFRGKR